MTEPTLTLDPERTALLAELATARAALVTTTRGLTDEQAGARPTASALCLGGLILMVDRPLRVLAGGTGREVRPGHALGQVAMRSARQVLMHLIAETAQHAGHADILRESIDGHTAS